MKLGVDHKEPEERDNVSSDHQEGGEYGDAGGDGRRPDCAGSPGGVDSAGGKGKVKRPRSEGHWLDPTDW